MKTKLLFGVVLLFMTLSARTQTNYCGTNTLFANGNFEGFTTGTGAGGADESALNTTGGGGTIGFGAQYAGAGTTDNRIADDFTNATCWNPSALTFYAYQTNSTTTSTITGIPRIELWNTMPVTGGTPLYISTSNTITNNVWTNVYRVTSTTSGNNQRPIMAVTIDWPSNFPTTLQAGTYWLVWQFEGSLASGPWAPPAAYLSSGNGRQYTSATWNAAVDGGTLGNAEFPFRICGTIGSIPITATSTPSIPMCPGTNYTFAGSGGNTYTWSGPMPINDNSPFVATSSHTGTYIVTGTDAVGCTGTTSLSLNLLPEPTASFVSPASILCDATTSTLNTQASGGTVTPTNSYPSTSGLPLAIPDGVGGSAWVTPGTMVSNSIVVSGLSGNITSPADVTLSINMDHTWIGDLKVNLVTPSNVVIPLINRLGAPTTTSAGSSANFVSANTLNFSIAAASQIDVTGLTTSSNIPIGLYLPSAGSAFTPGDLNLLTGESKSGTWTLQLQDGTADDLGTLTSWSITFVGINYSHTISGSGTVGTTSHGGPSFMNGVTPISSLPMGPLTYTCTVTDALGCTGSTSISISNNPTPVVTATATPNTTCQNTSVTPIGGGASTYVWSGGLTDATSFVATVGATIYTVTGTDAGCSATSTVEVIVNPNSGILAPATSNQNQQHADDFSISYYDATCNLIATIDDDLGGNTLGATITTVNVESTAGIHNTQPFVRRWYQIVPTNNIGVSAMVTLYISQTDFDDYNSVVMAPYLQMPTTGSNSDPNIPNIRITKNSDAGLGNTPEVITPTVNWNGNYWELSFPVTSFSQFRVHSVNGLNAPLPASISNFSGRKLASSDLLEWTTVTEFNNARFNIQHSVNGVDFKTIGTMQSKAVNGNSTEKLSYNFVNPTPQLGHNYYRLEQVDINQKSSLHANVVDLIWSADGNNISFYPNPTNNTLHIDFYASKDQNMNIKLFDVSGRLVKQIDTRTYSGSNTLTLSLGDLANGVYTLQVFENGRATNVTKITKQ